MIQLLIMKNTISIFAVLAIVFGANCGQASECIDEDCELEPVVVEETIEYKPQEEVILWSATDYEPEIDETIEICEYDYECPFNTVSECEIWYKKPAYNETVAPRAPHLNTLRMDDILYAINSHSMYSANDAAFAPLIERYKMLIRASHACCMDGIIYKLHQNKADDAAIYQFLKDDANTYAITQRCLLTTNDEILKKYSGGVNGEMVADVRNACLCKNREWFDALLEPFNDIYWRAPQFENEEFIYEYTDSMGREISVSINEDVHTVMEMLSGCPK